MDIRQLKYFVATAETGQVNRAAKNLSISQSSVTAAIRQIEDELDVALFERLGSGMELTDSGRELLGSAREIIDKMEEARRLTRKRSPVEGKLSLVATYTVMGYFLPMHLDRLARSFPGLDIQLSEMNRESIEEGLLSNRYDMAVLLTSNLSNPEIESETLVKATRRLWTPHDHPFYRKGGATFAEIAQEDYIMLTVDEAANTTMNYWSLTGLAPKVNLRTSSVEAVRSMVANGRGVTILSDMVYRRWSLEGQKIGTVSTDHEIPTLNVGLAWRRGKPLSREAGVVFDYFRQLYLSPQWHYSTHMR